MASRTAPRLLSSLSRRTLAPSLLADASPATTILARHTIPRFNGRNPFSASYPAADEAASPASPAEPSSETAAAAAADGQQQARILSQPHYQLTFTCVPCGERSQHTVSKQGYHHGSVLITCPDCRNRHVISDHLGVFGDRKGVTIEDLMRERGLIVKKGTLGEDGNIEFWEDDLPPAEP